jgi:hypothetical protein
MPSAPHAAPPATPGFRALASRGAALDGPRIPLRPVRHRRHALRSGAALILPPLAGWAWASSCLARLAASCAEAPSACVLCEFPLAASLPVGITLAFVAVMAWVGDGLEASPPPLGLQARAEAVAAVIRGDDAAGVARGLQVHPAAVRAWTDAWLAAEAEAQLETGGNAGPRPDA